MVEFAEWLGATPLSVWIQSARGLIPFVQGVHIVMIGIVFVSILMVALRINERIATDQPLGAVWARHSRWFWTGVIVMAATGAVLIVAEPVREFTAVSFWLKMLLIALGISIAAAFGRRVTRYTSEAGEAEAAPASLRIGALGVVALWMVIIFLGRAIAYDGAVWS